jgi:hypothetical protein
LGKTEGTAKFVRLGLTIWDIIYLRIAVPDIPRMLESLLPGEFGRSIALEVVPVVPR